MSLPKAFGLTLLLGAGCRPVLAPRVPVPDADPSTEWEALLAEVVREDGFVDYDALEARRDALDRYVAWISRKRPQARTNRHGFLIDAFNAFVLYAVLKDGRPASVRDVEGWLPVDGSGFYFERAFLLEGVPTSLAEIRHEHLRHRFLDYRDHAALNGATASSPPLRPELYARPGLERRLDDQMRRWVADEVRGVRIEGDEAVFSPLFDRFAWDFELQTAGKDLCTVTARFAEGEKKEALKALARQGCPHRFAAWDASLNDAARHALLAVPTLRDVPAPEPEEVTDTDP